MNIDIHGAPIRFTIPILGGIPITDTLLVTWGVMIILTGLCIWLTRDLKVKDVGKRQVIAEKLVELAEGLVRSNMGENNMGFVPMVATIIALSVFSSLSSLIGLWPPTADLMTPLAWGLVVFVIITYRKLKTNGFAGYLKGFCDPIFLMAPFNVLGEIFRPISMAFRHFGNIVAGTVITTLIYAALQTASSALFGLLPGIVGDWLSAIPLLSVGIPAVISLYFDWFGAIMQAYIFCMLTMLFIKTAAE